MAPDLRLSTIKPVTLTSVTGSCDVPPTYEYSFTTHSPYTIYYGVPHIKKYIINEYATIIFWTDNTKTISKRHKEDKFDKELGFLFAYFYKKYNGSNASRKRVIDCIDYKKIKTFLFEFYVNDTQKTPEQARKYLSNLKSEFEDQLCLLQKANKVFKVDKK